MQRAAFRRSILILVTFTGLLKSAGVRAATFSNSLPAELRFSDAMGLDGREEAFAKTLLDDDSGDRLAAARALWRGHSRRHASKVLKYLADPPRGGEEYRTCQREVEASFQPPAILHELREGDYPWGAWLAFLRPHKDFVPVLLANIKNQPKLLHETMLALGNSGDPRVLEPLLELLKSKDYGTPGGAAQALGYFGGPDVEPNLIGALAVNNAWLQVQACGALAKVGTRRSLPKLVELAKDDRYTGALNVKRMAQHAIESITNREKR